MKIVKLFFVFFAVFLFLTLSLTHAQDYNNADARSKLPSISYNDVILTFGDSCSVVNPERHDGYRHANGYPTYADSMRYVIKMSPSSYPWQYSKVCVGFTCFGGLSLTYYVVMYDSTSSGPGTNLLYISQPYTASSVPIFPLMGWYSSQDTLPVINSGAVYIGVRFQLSSGQSKYISIDEDANTPLWPGYLTASSSPVWSPIQNNYSGYKCCAIRTEGMIFVGINNNSKTIPDKFSLSQNYPNPFNPVTKIEYQVSKSTDVHINVYDMLGREVAALVNEFKQAGVYNIDFNASNLASGVYFYKMTAGDFTAEKKMSLVK
jgi:hypothetical protein